MYPDRPHRHVVKSTKALYRRGRVDRCRFENGKVAEIWNHRDDLGLMEQLGARVHAGAARDA